MTFHQVSEAAAASGFSADTLRYYERIGLLAPPARSHAGYRLYDDDDLDTLRFIRSAKTAGLSLDDIAELVALWRTGDCEPVRDRLHQLVCERADAARAQVRDLVAFADRLDGLVSALAGTTAPERCGPGCGCAAGSEPVALSGTLADACTLPADQLPERFDEWLAVAGQATTIDADGRIVLPVDATLAARAVELAVLEQGCCGGLLRFEVLVAPDAVTVTVRGAARVDFVAALAAVAGVQSGAAPTISR